MTTSRCLKRKDLRSDLSEKNKNDEFPFFSTNRTSFQRQLPTMTQTKVKRYQMKNYSLCYCSDNNFCLDCPGTNSSLITSSRPNPWWAQAMQIPSTRTIRNLWRILRRTCMSMLGLNGLTVILRSRLVGRPGFDPVTSRFVV